MARPLRIEYPGAIYHITSRGNDKNPIFLDSYDRDLFLDILLDVNRRYQFIIHAYCFMNNHYHLLVETPEANLSKGMRQLNGVYTQSFNRKHKKVGHIFQGRYKAILVDRESYLLQVARYIVLNPTRAGLAKNPKEYRFSSYPATAGFRKPQPCLSIDWILAQFGKNRKEAQLEYRRFVRDGFKKGSVLEEAKGQILLGPKDFVSKFLPYLKKDKDRKEVPKVQRYISRPDLNSLFNQEAVTDRNARNTTIKGAVEAYGYSQKEIADHLGLHYSTVSRLMKKNQKRATNKT